MVYCFSSIDMKGGKDIKDGNSGHYFRLQYTSFEWW